MKIASWNVNGIRAAYKKGFKRWLDAEAADIVCVQETKAQLEQLGPEITDIAGYTSYWGSAERKGYSGVGVYSKPEALDVQTTFSDPFDAEGRVVMVKYPAFTLFNIYFPNGRRGPDRLDYKLQFYDEILALWQSMRGAGIPLIVCGDVNTAHREIDLARPKQNEAASGFLPIERDWLDRVFAGGFVDIFRQYNTSPGQYTYWDMITRARARNVGWRIDYFLISDDLVPRVSDAWIASDVQGSDHCPIGLEIDL